MRFELVDGKLQVNLAVLVDSLSDEAKAEFFENLVFEERLLLAFAQMASGNYIFDRGLYETTLSGNGRVQTLAGKVREVFIPLLGEAYAKQMAELKEHYEKACKQLEETNRDLFDVTQNYRRLKNQVTSEASIMIGDKFYRVKAAAND